jgi:hypothetical protein
MGIPRGRGREPGFRMSAEHRSKIANSQILSCLINHVEGTREMSGTQVTAAIALLKKVMPDLAAIQHSGEDGGPMKVEFIIIHEVKKEKT